jgi:hypothetical protein
MNAETNETLFDLKMSLGDLIDKLDNVIVWGDDLEKEDRDNLNSVSFHLEVAEDILYKVKTKLPGKNLPEKPSKA